MRNQMKQSKTQQPATRLQDFWIKLSPRGKIISVLALALVVVAIVRTLGLA